MWVLGWLFGFYIYEIIDLFYFGVKLNPFYWLFMGILFVPMFLAGVVKTKAPNDYGLYDMSGNVFEWCWDWRGEINASTELEGPLSGTMRVLRGGNWNSDEDFCKVFMRNSYLPKERNVIYGFRVVRSCGK